MKMMKKVRKIIEINEALCNGCRKCVTACAEGAIQMVNGKAKLVSDSYCDGLGNCIGDCPTGALKIVEREAVDFDEAAVIALQKKQQQQQQQQHHHDLPCGCPGTQMKDRRNEQEKSCCEKEHQSQQSALRQWPIQIHLVSPHASFLQGADLLIAADCCAFAYADFHHDFLKNRSVLIGCPKLDDANAYIDRLTDVFKEANIKSITVLRMEVPCCMGITHIAKQALQASGMEIPFKEIIISVEGRLD